MDSIWIALCTRLRQVLLQEHHRPYHSLTEDGPTSYPQMMMFIGCKDKTLFMRWLFLIKGRENHHKVHLLRIPGTTGTSSPTFIADCELHNVVKFRPALISPAPGVIDQRSIRWQDKVPGAFHPNTIASLLYSRLISPFCNAICFFVDDLGGSKATAKFITSWVIKVSAHPSDLPSIIRPRALILSSLTDPNVVFDEKLATIRFMRELRLEIDSWHKGSQPNNRLTEPEFHSLLQRHFSDLRVLCLPPNVLDAELKHWTHIKGLRTRILQESEDIQRQRHVANVAFSAMHFTAFLRSAFNHFSSEVTPFGFIPASRVENPIPEDLASHLNNVLNYTSQRNLTAYVPMVASALCLDSYPPGMHYFDPVQMYRNYFTVFRKLKSLQKRYQSCLFDCFQDNVQEAFCNQAVGAFQSSKEIASLHKANLLNFPHWKSIRNNGTCLSCLARCPEHMLSCCHSLCDTCIVIHGHTNIDNPWHFSLESCPLCGVSNNIAFTLKPYTAGERCLSIAGSDSEDLSRLLQFERSLNLPLRFQDYFDFVTGSGLGALVVLQVFCNERSISDSFKELQIEDLTPKCRFSEDSTAVGSILQENPLGFLSCCFKSSNIRPATNLKGSLSKELHFGFSGNGKKIAIIIPQHDCLTLFSTYSGNDKKSNLYNSIRPNLEKTGSKVWQVAKGIRSTLDVKRDFNLIEITLAERDVIWSFKERDLDVLVCTTQTEKNSSIYDIRNEQEGGLAAEKLIASMFYIELLGAPIISEMGLSCRAYIRCRLLPRQSAFSVLIHQLRASGAFFSYDGISTPCVNIQLLEEVKRGIPFSRYIEFSMASIQDPIDIKIMSTSKIHHSISNCPYILKSLIHDQGLDCFFGHKDHQIRF